MVRPELPKLGFSTICLCGLLNSLRCLEEADRLPVVIWGCFVVAFGFFTLLTRIHERYVIVALPRLSAIAAYRTWLLPFLGAVTALSLANLLYSYATDLQSYWHEQIGDLELLISTASMFEVQLFLLSLVILVALVTRLAIRIQRRERSVSNIHRRYLALNVGNLIIFALIALTISQLSNVVLPWDRLVNPGAHVVKVRAERSWQDTGVQVFAGQQLVFIAYGEWTNQSRGDKYGPDGSNRIDGGAILPSAPIGILLGRIGESPPFIIGSNSTITTSTGGTLELVMNDWPLDRHDSRGSVIVAIRVFQP